MSEIPNEKNSSLEGVHVYSQWGRRIMTFLMVFGPGLIVMEADNDAGAVSTYTQAGGQYGTSFLWILLLLLPVCYFVQEMVARLGIATGEGHAAMIYKRFGKWWGRFSLFDLQLLNFLTLVTEFAAVDLAFSKMGVSPFVAVPMVAVGMIIIVMSASYRRWEAVTILFCLLDVSWIFMACHVGPPAMEVLHKALVPSLPPSGLTSDYVFLVIAIVGTTIAPWQLFFQQSCVADKRLRFKDLKWERLDTLFGACFTIVVAWCMVLVGDAAFRWGQGHGGYTYADPAQLADYLDPVYGPWVRNGILLLMVNAAMLGTTAISLSSAWAYGEVKGWPSSLNFGPKDAPGFYTVYAIAVLSAAGLVLIPNAPLQLIIMSVQVLAGIMLPSSIIFLQLLLNDRELLGEEFVNKPWNNWVNWTIIVVLFALSLVLAAQVMLPRLFPQAS
jgi:Mn2+/Fe2+ NRAMP family transporter